MHTPVPEPSGLRQRKKDRLRASIVSVANRMFLERGYEATSIDDIANELEISSRTIYRYFASKDEIVVAGPFQIAAGMRTFAESAPPDLTPLDIVRAAVRAVAERRMQRPRALEEATMLARVPELASRLVLAREQWAREFAAGLAGRIGEPDATLKARMLTASALWVLGASLEQWIDERGERPITEIMDVAFAFIDRTYADDAVRRAELPGA